VTALAVLTCATLGANVDGAEDGTAVVGDGDGAAVLGAAVVGMADGWPMVGDGDGVALGVPVDGAIDGGGMAVASTHPNEVHSPASGSEAMVNVIADAASA